MTSVYVSPSRGKYDNMQKEKEKQEDGGYLHSRQKLILVRSIEKLIFKPDALGNGRRKLILLTQVRADHQHFHSKH